MAYNRNGRGAQRQFNNRGNNNARPSNKRGTLLDVLKEKDPDGVAIAQFIRNSASMRRHVSLAIKYQMIESGKVNADDSIYVKFGLTHYTVRVNGLGTDYAYSNLMVLRAMLASCITTSTQIQKLVNGMCVAQYDDTLTEVSDLSGKEAQDIITNLSEKVLAHIDEKVDED